MPADLYDGLTETQRVIRWRFLEARAAGLDRREAAMYAESNIDCAELRHAVAKGATPQEIAKIVL